SLKRASGARSSSWSTAWVTSCCLPMIMVDPDRRGRYSEQPEQAAPAQGVFTASVLRAKAFGPGLNLGRHLHEPALALVAAVAVARPPLMVVEILAVGIPLRDPVQALRLAHVPAHEVHCIAEIVAAGEPASGFALVIGPGFILGLRIAI